MKKAIVILTAVALSAFIPVALTIWNSITEKVQINFELPQGGTKGTISGLKSEISFDEKKIEESKINASVDVKTLTTDNEQKTAHLLSPDFFDAEKYPTMSFASTSFKRTDSTLVAIGNLSIKDSVKVVEIPFKFEKTNKDEGVFSGKLTIHSGDFGVGKKSKTGKDEVVVNISVPVKK